MISNRIKVLRAERDWTQADLAERVGISRQAVISIEKYKYTPSLELAFKIAEAFGVSIDQVFGGAAPAAQGQRPNPHYRRAPRRNQRTGV